MSKELWLEDELGDNKVYSINSQVDIDNLPINIERVFVKFNDWCVVPTENILAKYSDTKVVVKTNSLSDMITLGKALGRGVDGFLVDQSGLKVHQLCLNGCDVVNNLPEGFEYEFEDSGFLVDAVVTSIAVRQADVSVDRVCIDCADSFSDGEGLLIGPSPEMLFLVNSENLANPYVDTRPWRVNAGSPSSYVLLFDGSFKYLSDLSSDDVLLAVDYKCNTRPITINRLKIEDRGMSLIKARYKSIESHIYLQTAETVRLGDTAVTNLMVGDRVKVYLGGLTATHFGKTIDERIEYK